MTIVRPLRLPTLVLAAALATVSIATAQPPDTTLLIDAADASQTLPDRAVPGSGRVGRINPGAFMANRVRVTLPDGRVLAAERQQEMRGAQGQVSWVGAFEDAPGSLLVVTIHRGVVTGFLHHGAETYELGVAEDGRSLLFQVDEAQLPDEGEPVPVLDPSPEAALDAEFAEAASAADVIVQDLFVAYTPAAVTRAGSVATLESMIVNAVAAANSAYVSSAANLRLNLVGLSQTNYTETGNMSTTLTRLREPADGYMDELHTKRNQTSADLVALVSDDSNYCGIAYVMSSVSSSFESSAFSVVYQGCFSNQTLAHELGHNQGNSHDRANGGSSAYPYSFGYRTCDNIAPTAGQSFRTVMGYSCSGTPRVNYFSNPAVLYNGAPMGVSYTSNPSNAADNVRSMNNTAAVTAAFRSSASATPPAAPTSIAGSASASDAIALSWVDRSSDETGFTLERAVGGGSFSTRATLSTNATSFVDSGLTASTSYQYRVRAFNSAGTSSWSSTVTVQTPAAVPAPSSPAPATVAVTGTTAVVQWANVSGETSFSVVRDTYNSRKRKWTSTTYTVATNTTVFSQSLNNGTYRYRVSAVNATGTSAAATALCASCGSDGSFIIASSAGSKDGNGKGKDRP